MSQQSEIAQLKQQIAAEYETAKQGLTGLAQGTAQHAFIQRKMEKMHSYQKSLIDLVGMEKASEIIAEVGL
jgi:hypothetical protein